jgi:hypothetical protein
MTNNSIYIDCNLRFAIIGLPDVPRAPAASPSSRWRGAAPPPTGVAPPFPHQHHQHHQHQWLQRTRWPWQQVVVVDVPLCRCGPVGTRCNLGCTQWNVMYVLPALVALWVVGCVAGCVLIIYYLFIFPKET